MNQESEYQVRPFLFFFLMIQKSGKNCAKHSLKRLTFTTLRPTLFKSFFCKLEVIALNLPSCLQIAKKLFIFRKKAVVYPPVYHTRCPFYCLHVAGKLVVNTNCFQVLV